MRVDLKRGSKRATSLTVAGLLLALAVGLAWWLKPATSPSWEAISIASLGAEVLFADASAIARRGPGRVLILRFSQPMELVPHHFREERLPGPLPVESWATHLGAQVVFNAGQFDEALDHLGLLKADGRWLSQRRKPAWKGLLVSGPTDGAVWARIVDLDDADATVVERYRHVVQSMMLVDATSKVRVRDTELTASRSIVAEDKRGRILLLFTEGATTLADLARWLPRTDLGIVRAMNLDGGIESQLAIGTPELRLTLYGQYGTGAAWSPGAGSMHYPLPAVVAARRP